MIADVDGRDPCAYLCYNTSCLMSEQVGPPSRQSPIENMQVAVAQPARRSAYADLPCCQGCRFDVFDGEVGSSLAKQCCSHG